MAIKCALTTEQIEFVYGLSKQAIQAKFDKGEPFNVDTFMKYFYDRVQKVNDRDAAAQFLAVTPAIIEQVVLNNFANQVDQIEGYDKISTLKAKWSDPNTVIKNVVNALEQTKRDLRLQNLINQQEENVSKQQPVSQSQFDYGTTTRYKAINVLSGSLNSFVPGATKYKAEEVDEERRAINKTLEAIADDIALQNTVLDFPTYNGVKIRLRAVNLGNFTDNNNKNFNALDSITQKSIRDSRRYMKQGRAKAGVAQVNERVIMLIANEQGKPLKFNHETGDIVADNDPKGKFAYQEMRVVRKVGNSYSIRDIYNLEDKVRTSEEIAEIRVKESEDLNLQESLKQVNAEFKEYYDLQQAAIKQDIMLNFIGMTPGVDIEATKKKFPLQDLVNEGIVDKADLSDDIRTLTNPENGFRTGVTLLEINGEPYQLAGVTVTDDITKQIVDALYSTELDYDTKKTVYNQFLNDAATQDRYKKHQILFNDKDSTITIVTFKNTDPTNSKNQITGTALIKPSGEVSNIDRDAGKAALFKAIRNVFPSGDGRYLNYNDILIKNPLNFQEFKNGKLVDSNYIDFLLRLNPTTTQPVSYVGSFNKQMLFKREAKNNTQTIPKSIPIDQRFAQLSENEYLHDLILQKNQANVPQLQSKYKGKLIYSTPGLFSQEAFEGTGVIYQNDVTAEVIEDNWRKRKPGETIREFIKDAGYNSNKWQYVIKPAVKNRVAQLVAAGETVVSESVSEIESADLVVLGDRNNPGVESFDLNDSFFNKEQTSVERYIVNLNNPPAAPSIKVTPAENKTIVETKVTGTDTSKSNNTDPKTKPPKGGGLTLFRGGSESSELNPDVVTPEEIKRANEFWAGPLGQRFEKDGITLNRAANLVNSDAFAKFVISGINLTNFQINIGAKGTMVDVYHESWHAFSQLYLTKEEKIKLYEELRNFTDENGNQPYLNKSYLELEEILAEEFRTYMKDQKPKPNAPVRNSLFRRIVEFLKTLLGVRKAIDAQDIPTTKEFVDLHTKAFNLVLNNKISTKQKEDLVNQLRTLTGGSRKQTLKGATDAEVNKALLNDYLNYAKAQYKGGSIKLKNTLQSWGRRTGTDMLLFNDAIIGEDLDRKTFKMAGKTFDFRTAGDIANKAFRNTYDVFSDSYNMVKDAQVDIMAIPTVKELFENLKIGNPKFLNKYEASVDNAMFFDLDRGPLFVNKINNERRRRTALSKTDGDVVVESMDSIISDMIDKQIAAETTDETDLGTLSQYKGLNLSALLEDQNIPQVYTYIKDELKAELAKTNKEYLKSVGREDQAISAIETIDDLKNSAAAVLKTKDGSVNKYVFLENQIDDFNQFDSDFKAGERVKGEEWKGIKIVGNYFTHSSIKDTVETSKGKTIEVPAQVIVVSRLEDAKIQYDNYVRGKAKEYVGVEFNKDVEDSELDQDQINLLNKIRILQTSINEFGDVDYAQNGTKPAGMIKYHMENSIFELKKNNYFTEDEDVDEEQTPEKEEAQRLDPDQDSFKKSLYDLADKEVIFILKSLHETDGTKVNSLGFRKMADFRKTWNTISKLIGGVQSRQEMYDIIEAEQENYPIFKQLIKYKLAQPESIQSGYAFDVSNSFWHTFSRPSAKFWQLSVDIKEETDESGTTYRAFQFIVTRSTVNVSKILSESKALFAIAKGPYMSTMPGRPSRLKIQKVREDFFNESGVFKNNRKAEFLRTLGFKLDNSERLNAELNRRAIKDDIGNLTSLVKDIAALDNKAPEEKTEVEKDIVNKFIASPIAFLQNESFLKERVSLLKSFKNIESLRPDSIVKSIARVQASYGFDTASDSVILPDGNTAQPIANHSSANSIILGINKLENLEQAYVKNGHLSFLNPNENNKDLPYNPLAKRNKILQTMFPNGVRDKNKEMSFVLLAGTEVQANGKRDVGINTPDLVGRDKLFQAYQMMLSAGIGEFAKHSDKRGSFGITISKKKKWGNYNTGTDENLWIDTQLFDKLDDNNFDKGHLAAANVFLLDYLANEFDRIQFFKRNPDVLKTTTGYNTKLNNGRTSGESFVLMDSMLSEETKQRLYDLADSGEQIDIIDLLRNDSEYRDLLMDIYNETENYFLGKSEYVKSTLSGLLRIDPKFREFSDDALALSYTYNAFINKVEMSNLINGDLAQFKQYTKRIPGSTSDGNSFLYDQGAIDFINNVFQSKNVLTYATNQLNTKNFKFDGTLNTGVIADPERTTIYLDELEEAWREGYEAMELSEEEIKVRLARDISKYTDIEEADGAAFITIDAYRVLRKLGNKWGQDQENLYKDIVQGNPVDPAQVNKFFPVYKLHNYGPLMNSKIATTSMYKFAVAPLIPSLGKENSELTKLHDKMIKSGLQMVTFKTGSKVASITSKANTSADNIFETRENIGKVDMSQKYVSETLPIANNKIHLRYLKDVSQVADKLKKKITVPTQSRAAIESKLYKRGELVNKENKAVADAYRNAVSGLTAALETQLLNEIGFKKTKTGRYIPMSEGSLEKLARTVRAELASKGAPQQLQNIVDVNVSGNSLKIDFSIHPEAEVIEGILAGRISKAISSQKTKGEKTVQVPNTFYNGIWNSEEQIERIKDDIEAIKNELGTNNLPFYRRGKIDENTGKRGPTQLAKVAIAFNGDFVNLVELEYIGKDGKPDGTLIKDIPAGSEITPRERLNEMLQNETWMAEHAQKVTITGPRIPTDNTNLIEAFEVYHFIDPAHGTTAVVPTEIVAKAESDFDIDALFFSFPNINKDGSLPTEVKDFENKIAKLREQKKDVKSLIEQQRRFAENNLIKTSVDVLRLPEIYAPLTKPGDTFLFEREVDDADEKSYSTEYTSIDSVPAKVFEEEYDIDIFDLLMGGSTPLGIGAKKSKQSGISTTTGSKMPLFFLENKYLKRDVKIRFPHNQMEKGNISLSDIVNKENVNISDIISHALQGVLDRGNSDKVMRAGITKESFPVMLRMIESGVPLPTVINFIKSPLIQRYLKNVAASKGVVAKLRKQDLTKKTIVDLLIKETVFADENAIKFYNEKSINQAFEVLKQVNRIKIPGEGISSIKLTYFDGSESQDAMFFSYADFEKFAKTMGIRKPNINFIELNGNTLYNKLYDGDSPGLKFRSYHLGEYFWNKSFGKGFPTAQELKSEEVKNNANKQVALLFEFLNIENQSSGMDNFEISFNPDTSLIRTLHSAKERRATIDKIAQDSKVDRETIERYINNSILSSMYRTDIFIDVIQPLFDLRLNEEVQSAIWDKFNSLDEKELKKRFGEDHINKYITAMNNGLIDYIYQNVMSSYVDNKGLPVELPKIMQDKGSSKEAKKVIRKKLDGDKIVSVTPKTIQIDIEKIKSNFEAGVHQDEAVFHNSDGIYIETFPTEASFIRFAIERELFREEYKDLQMSEEKFNQFITKRALQSSFNPGYIKGNVGYGNVPNTYTNDVLSFVKDPRFAKVVSNYPVLSHLSPAFFLQSKGYNLLDLNNKKLIDEDTAYDYFKQLRQLGDRSVVKIAGAENKGLNNSISDLFKAFSLIALYQQGSGKSGLSFIKALDVNDYVDILRFPAINFRLDLFGDVKSKSLKKLQAIASARAAVFNKIDDQVRNTKDFYKEYNVEPSEFLGANEPVQDPEINYSDLSDMDLYMAYKEALEQEEITNEGEKDRGTALVAEIEAELISRNLPLNRQAERSTKEKVEDIDGVELIENALTNKEQLELFEILKPFLQAQGAKTNKGKKANIMIGLNVRWDYISNNPNYKEIYIPEIIDERNRGKYGYYEVSINGEPLGPISPRIKELMAKATGVDTTNYDGAIINLYDAETFVSSHTDTSESADASGYPVLVANIGGKGNISIEGTESRRQKKDYNSKEYVNGSLNAGDAYVFGINGVNRDIYHRTLADPIEKGILPELTINNDNVNITYPAGSYRITITMRRVMPIKGTDIPSRPGPAKGPTTDDSTKGQIGEDGLNSLARKQRTRIIKENLEKPYSIALGKRNSDLILKGEKTTTLRTKEIPDGIYDIDGKLFVLTSRLYHPYLTNASNKWFGEPDKFGSLPTKRKAEKIVANQEYTREEILDLLDSEALPRVPSEENKYKIDFDGDVWFAKFPSTVDFFEKGRGLYVYDIKPFVASEYGYEPILDNDVEFDRNDPATYVNHSGGAIGADSMFDKIGKEFGQIIHNHYYYNNKTPLGNVPLNEDEFLEGVYEMNKAAELLGKKPRKARTIELLARNWHQVKNSDSIIAIAPIDDSLKFVEGGTGWAVAMAQVNADTQPRNIYVFNLKDNTWYVWNNKPRIMRFVKTATPTLTKNFAGIGSQQNKGEMTPESIQAIRDVYEKTFGKPPVEISSDAKGLAAALTNPTELAKRKGNLQQSYPILYTNGKEYADVEEAYQDLKDKSEARTKPSKQESNNYKLMVDLIATKLKAYPRLMTAIAQEGGTEWLSNATHQPTNQNTVWETGGQNWFISALVDAYGIAQLKPKVQFDEIKGKKIINNEDIAAFKKYKEKSGGINPKEFFTTKTRFAEFYNSNTGKREGAPHTSIWVLDFASDEAGQYNVAEVMSDARYNLIDKVTGEMYISNVSLETGFQYVKKIKPPKGTGETLFEIDPVLENFYRSLTKEQLKKLPSMDAAQERFNGGNHGYNTMTDYVNALKQELDC